MEAAVAYLRVSTRQQQRSGLGIEAQRATIARFAEAEHIQIIAEYVETETGKGADALDRAAPTWPPRSPPPRPRSAASWSRSWTGSRATWPSSPGLWMGVAVEFDKHAMQPDDDPAQKDNATAQLAPIK